MHAHSTLSVSALEAECRCMCLHGRCLCAPRVPSQVVTVLEERISAAGEVRACVSLDSITLALDSLDAYERAQSGAQNGALSSRSAASPRGGIERASFSGSLTARSGGGVTGALSARDGSLTGRSSSGFLSSRSSSAGFLRPGAFPGAARADSPFGRSARVSKEERAAAAFATASTGQLASRRGGAAGGAALRGSPRRPSRDSPRPRAAKLEGAHDGVANARGSEESCAAAAPNATAPDAALPARPAAEGVEASLDEAELPPPLTGWVPLAPRSGGVPSLPQPAPLFTAPFHKAP